MRCTSAIGVQRGLLSPSHHKRLGAVASHALHTCVCLVALHMQWCHKPRGVSLMQRAQSVCFLAIVRVPRHIASCVLRCGRLSEVVMLGLLMIAVVLGMVWR